MCYLMVIFNYQRIPQNIIDSVPANWGIGNSDSGWMVSEVFFYEFIANVFHPFVVQSGISFPVIRFVDGHKSHLTYHLSTLCTNLKIILIVKCNTTRILEPADVAASISTSESWLEKWSYGLAKQTFEQCYNQKRFCTDFRKSN
jgi:hypothetical protein